jgi:hypothetical protein
MYSSDANSPILPFPSIGIGFGGLQDRSLAEDWMRAHLDEAPASFYIGAAFKRIEGRRLLAKPGCARGASG